MKKLPGATAADSLRARETVSGPVAEYLVALGSALPPEPNDPEAAFTGTRGPGLFAYTRRAYPRRFRQTVPHYPIGRP